MSNLSKGILAMLISALAFTVMGVCLKLSGELPVVQKSIFRNAIAAALSGFLVWRHQVRFFAARANRKTLIWRSIFGLSGILMSFYSIDHLVLSDADMIMKLSPFILIVLSAIFLQERVTPKQIAFCTLAFVGLMLIIKPSFETALFPYLVALGGAITAAGAYLMLRVLALSKVAESSYTIVFFFSFFSTVALLPPLLFVYEPMSGAQLLFLIGSGVAATFGQFGITLAYRFASAKEVSIYSYTSVIFAALFSVFLFNEMPDWASWLGYILIFISGYGMFLLNRHAARKEAA
ncbi:DMT family transporter [Pasteurellaceae bacterium 20609_3]|uniref:DMT family transporter n=1 Tax=Spirabiliibacterium mucosae TaxID=28156 RepID=UPI001AAD4621|nr:DMT family transporter [Spirabiliibacterium mucosae]MBE2898557.1 DMT family transporter [Spirabiliibacterium mucosae]